MTVHNKMFDEKQKTTVMVSGGFDPVHAGHIRMILEASKTGDVIVIANSDQWLFRKKGFVFMDFEQRAEILNAVKGVIIVDSVDDSDGTVCDAIRRHNPTYFANGGDRGRTNTPEQQVCEELGVKMLWSVGGDEKRDSSSELVKRVKNKTPVRAETKHSGR
jgi:cytidyltransferase-like protein|tara:strand:- start:5401 stop:5883 length:483 start_codon:yes stop_codon:yes gene_type:complete